MNGVRHVWVREPHTPTERPGLVLDWRRDEANWSALVTWVERGDRVVTTWLPADTLRPVEDRPRTATAYDLR